MFVMWEECKKTRLWQMAGKEVKFPLAPCRPPPQVKRLLPLKTLVLCGGTSETAVQAASCSDEFQRIVGTFLSEQDISDGTEITLRR